MTQTEYHEKVVQRVARGIKALRLADGMSQNKLAKKCQISLYTVQKWEQGVSSPSYPTMKWLFHCTGWTERELLRGQRDAST